MLLRVERQCGATAYFMATDVEMITGPGRGIQEVRFGCKRCLYRPARVVPFEVDRDRLPRIMIYRPFRMGSGGPIMWALRRFRG